MDHPQNGHHLAPNAKHIRLLTLAGMPVPATYCGKVDARPIMADTDYPNNRGRCCAACFEALVNARACAAAAHRRGQEPLAVIAYLERAGGYSYAPIGTTRLERHVRAHTTNSPMCRQCAARTIAEGFDARPGRWALCRNGEEDRILSTDQAIKELGLVGSIAPYNGSMERKCFECRMGRPHTIGEHESSMKNPFSAVGDTK